MAKALKHDLKGLEKKITILSKLLSELSSEKEFKELILAIKRPGWTTPAEFLFATSIVDSLSNQAKVLTTLKKDLLKGSKLVSAGQPG